jgi:hypothetical protein
MRARRLPLALGLILSLAVLAVAFPAAVSGMGGKRHGDGRSHNLFRVGSTHDRVPVETFEEPFFTDLAFQGRYAYQGTWNGGFRVVDISRPWRPKVRAEVDCGSAQGDIAVFGDLVFRAVDSPVAAETVEDTCDAPAADTGFEGIQIFDVDKPWRASADDLVAAVPTDCGARSLTVVPDLRRHRVLVYVAAGPTQPEYNNDPVWVQECSEEHDKFQIVEVPLRRPEDASVLADAVLDGGHTCDDIAVLSTRSKRLAACAGNEAVLFDIANPAEPQRIRSFAAPGVPVWSSAAFSWDGSVVALAWEPAGGLEASCEASDPARGKSIVFFATETGEQLGAWTLPRAQSAAESCAIHSLGVAPTRKRNVLVAGVLQAGTWVVDFTDPAQPKTLAWSDPRPLADTLTFGGAWASYWYNGLVYESNVTKGLKAYAPAHGALPRGRRLPILNPQTQLGPRRPWSWHSWWH